jgi:hypothetical protein
MLIPSLVLVALAALLPRTNAGEPADSPSSVPEGGVSGVPLAAKALSEHIRSLEPLGSIPTFQEDSAQVASHVTIALFSQAIAACDVSGVPVHPAVVLALLRWQACPPQRCSPDFANPLAKRCHSQEVQWTHDILQSHVNEEESPKCECCSCVCAFVVVTCVVALSARSSPPHRAPRGQGVVPVLAGF